jgi:hypothetical protein
MIYCLILSSFLIYFAIQFVEMVDEIGTSRKKIIVLKIIIVSILFLFILYFIFEIVKV